MYMNISKFMDGKKTYTGIAVALIGVFGFAKYISPEETASVIDLTLQLAGLIMAVYGRIKATPAK